MFSHSFHKELDNCSLMTYSFDKSLNRRNLPLISNSLDRFLDIHNCFYFSCRPGKCFWSSLTSLNLVPSPPQAFMTGLRFT